MFEEDLSAVDRMFMNILEKEASSLIYREGIKVGDTVMIRPYNEIGDEYRGDRAHVQFGFPRGMKSLCNEVFTISGFDDDYETIALEPIPMLEDGSPAWISRDMISLVQVDESIPDDLEVGNLDKLFG